MQIISAYVTSAGYGAVSFTHSLSSLKEKKMTCQMGIRDRHILIHEKVVQ